MTAGTISPQSCDIASTSPPQSNGPKPQSSLFAIHSQFPTPQSPANPTPGFAHEAKNRHNFPYSCPKNSKVILEHQATGSSLCDTGTFPFPNLLLPLPITTPTAQSLCETKGVQQTLNENTPLNPPPLSHLQTMPFIGVSVDANTAQQDEIMQPSPTHKTKSIFYSHSHSHSDNHNSRKDYEHRQMNLQHSNYLEEEQQLQVLSKQPILPIIKPRERIIEMEVGPEDYADLVQEANGSAQHLHAYRHQNSNIAFSQEDEAASGLLKLAMKADSNSRTHHLHQNAPQLRASASSSRLVAIQPATRRTLIGTAPLSAAAAGGVSKFMNSPTRRQAHIVSEQKRRQTINEGFDELRFLVPTCHNFNDSKATILKKTVNYLKSLQQKIEELSVSGVHSGFQRGDDSGQPAALGKASGKNERLSRPARGPQKSIVPSPESYSGDLSIEEDDEEAEEEDSC